MKKKLIVFSLLLLLSFCSFKISANSAQQYFYGQDQTGIFSLDESPIVVTQEDLIFNLYDVTYPPHDSNNVIAKYYFYNPENYSVHSRLVFPMALGQSYDYYLEDFENFSITVNGEEVNKKIRYTDYFFTNDFIIDNELKKLSDDYINDDFYSQELKIYSYDILENNGNSIANDLYCQIVTSPKDNQKLMSDSHTYISGEDDNNLYINIHFYWNNVKRIYYLGEEEPDLKDKLHFYDYKYEEELVNKNYIIEKNEEISFIDFVLSYYESQKERIANISEVDYYNIIIDKMNKTNSYCLGSTTDIFNISYTELLIWYDYEVDFAPKQTVINEVKAPIFPTVNMRMKPNTYEITYLLTPASTWKDFSNLNIYVNTNYYIISNSLTGFEKTSDGYVASYENLPQEELIFTISESANPKETNKGGFALMLMGIFGVLGIAIIFVGFLLIGGIVILIIYLIKKLLKKKT